MTSVSVYAPPCCSGTLSGSRGSRPGGNTVVELPKQPAVPASNTNVLTRTPQHTQSPRQAAAILPPPCDVTRGTGPPPTVRRFAGHLHMPPSPPVMREQPTEAFGPYLIYDRLGAGGMATVHRAVKRGIEGVERPVALKRLLPELQVNDEFVRAFVREARLAAQLRHQNICQTYDLGRVEGTYYIAMELVAGADLRTILRHTAYSTGPMPVPLVLNAMLQLCEALDYAHNFKDEAGTPLGLVHRDVSPANVIVGE